MFLIMQLWVRTLVTSACLLLYVCLQPLLKDKVAELAVKYGSSSGRLVVHESDDGDESDDDMDFGGFDGDEGPKKGRKGRQDATEAALPKGRKGKGTRGKLQAH